MKFDLVIVGASVTGSAVAALASERGLSVALVDAANEPELGRPRRRTPVPVWALEEARLPVGEVIGVPQRLHLVAGEARATVRAPDCVMLDPGALVISSIERARANGAALIHETEVRGLAHDGRGVETVLGDVIGARFVVDASSGSLLGERAVAPSEIASVAHETHAITDRRLADAHLDAADVARGESVAFLAPCGAGSMVVARVDDDARSIAFDAVALGDHGRRPTARAAIRKLARLFSWVGETTSEDARHVALGGLRGTLVSGNVALVGRAAGMRRPRLAGECALGIVSARMLVDAVVDGGLARYEELVRARFDKVSAFDGTIARVLRSLEEEDLAALLRGGAIGEPLVRSILEQRPSRLATLRFTGAATMRTARSAIARLARPAFEPALLTPLRILGGGRG